MPSSSKPLPTSFDFAQDRLWTLYDVIAPLVGKAVVANAYQVKLIAAARVKTDKSAVWSLARLLVAGLIPEVWVPPVPVRELRTLISHRRRLIQIRTCARNRLHSLILQPHLRWAVSMDASFRPVSAPSPIVTAAGLLSLGSPPARPGQPQFEGAGWQRQRDLQQPLHLWNTHFGQF